MKQFFLISGILSLLILMGCSAQPFHAGRAEEAASSSKAVTSSADPAASLEKSAESLPEETYEKTSTIACADGNSAIVTEQDSSQKSCLYSLKQGKDGSTVFISGNSPESGELVISDVNGKELQKIDWQRLPDSCDRCLQFLDFNLDGYADLQLTIASGTLNDEYEIYLWDAMEQVFKKVTIDSPDVFLSYFEVKDESIMVWGKEDASTMRVQTLIWKDAYTLTLDSETLINTETGETIPQ